MIDFVDFIEQYFLDYYLIIILNILLILLLHIKPKLASVDFRPLFITVVTIIICTGFEEIEYIISANIELTEYRIFLSVVCYWLRPLYCFGLIYVIVTEKRDRILIAIPEFINVIVMSGAFIPNIRKYVFYYENDGVFSRGVLGNTVFIVGFFYILFLLYLVVFKLREKNTKGFLLIFICSISIVVSTLLETIPIIYNVTVALVLISCIIYYLMIYIQFTSVDQLTGLYNRETFNVDLTKKHIVAVASIDMNGLKELNDSQGHKNGDMGLASVGKSIIKCSNRNVKGYRTGGDEFIVLFSKVNESTVKKVCDEIRCGVKDLGFSVSIGYAFSNGETIDELIRISDERMYADKDAFYAGSRKRR